MQDIEFSDIRPGDVIEVVDRHRITVTSVNPNWMADAETYTWAECVGGRSFHLVDRPRKVGTFWWHEETQTGWVRTDKTRVDSSHYTQVSGKVVYASSLIPGMDSAIIARLVPVTADELAQKVEATS